ncbi:MAG: aminopeptidase [Candidatus Zophobacter franzmannii]|nr:aminopeptidase [Candidatus Zophobacter franzmannii]
MAKKKETDKELMYERHYFWKNASSNEQKAAMDFAEGYKKFLDDCKTEREAIDTTIELLKDKGFKEILTNKKSKKVFATFRGKSVAFAILGKKPVSDGVNVVGSHVDAPRIDLKQNPFYEDGSTGMGMMRTHYYGGIKKYQWVSTPLALHGVVVKKDGSVVKISIGEDASEPVFCIPDLLPHLARKEQYSKTMGEAVSASNLNMIFSGMVGPDKKEKKAIKMFALRILKEKYDITESDFISAELEIVPAGKARDCGIDRSFVMGYGQDDRICAYTSLMALLDGKGTPEKTAIIYFADKEEIGSVGNTGASSIFLKDFIGDLLIQNGEECTDYILRKTLIKTNMLSADVSAGINPNYPSVHEKQNAPMIGYGVSVSKFTGSGGKGGSNDANAEYTAKVLGIFSDDKIHWQMGELGNVDVGGGGTNAYILARDGAEVIDCGTPLLGMHSLYEMCSKADLYSTYRAYKAFIEKA